MNLESNPKQAINVFHKAAFREFWDAKKKESAVLGMDLTGIPSPYAWEDKPRNEGNRSYVEGSQERADYEKLFAQAKAEPVAFGYIPPKRSIFMSGASLTMAEYMGEYMREFGNDVRH